MSRILPAIALVSSILFATAAGSAVTVVQDGDFADADWELLTYSFRSGGGAYPGGSVSASQQPEGNPGTRRDVTNYIAAAPSGTEYASTWGAHIFKGFSYDPAVQGAIGSIDHLEDSLKISGQSLTGPALRQGGKIYWAGGVPMGEGWRPFALRRLVPADFAEITAGGPVYGSQPDFSATGGPIEVGFVRANSNGAGSSAYPVFAAIDNWRIRLNPSCTMAAECDDADPCTVDDCIGGVCEGLDTCNVPEPNVKAEVHAVGTISGVTTPTDVVQEKTAATLTDTATAQAGSSPAGATGDAAASLAGGLRAKADATLLTTGQYVGATAIASHTRVFDVTGSPGPPPSSFDVNLLLFLDGALTTISGLGAPTPLDIAASVAFDVFVADGSGVPLATFQRYAVLGAGNTLGFPQIYPTSDWANSFGADSDPDVLTITRAMNYSELVTQTVGLNTPPRIAVEMRLTAEAHTTPALPQWTAISNFFDTATVQVTSPTPGVVLTEVDPAVTTTSTSSTTTTTLPPRAFLVIDGVRTKASGRGTIRARCLLADPSTRRGASCTLRGRSPGLNGLAVTGVVRHRFDKRGVAKLALALNGTGRKQSVRDGGIVVTIVGAVTERGGIVTSLGTVVVLTPPQ